MGMSGVRPRLGRVETYQDEIYLAGLQGRTPSLPTDLDALEAVARESLTPQAFGYIAGAAGTGETARANREAFRRYRIVPRMLTDVSIPDYSTTLFGTPMPAPVVLAPVGVLGIAHPDGECAVARAGTALGVPMILSTAASTAMEEVAAASGAGERWYQLYPPRDRELCVSLMRRASAAGFRVLVITLDTRMLGWRPQDLDQGYLPFLQGIGVQNYLSDPSFAGLEPQEAILRYTQVFGDPTLTWPSLPFFRQHWDGPIVLKGIISVGDARRAADAGMDGIVVSNHGGRQVDGALAALDALPAIAAEVGDRLTVLFDSGIRGGADVVKALALGASAVLLGRPYAYGLGLAGEDGVRHVLRCLRNDFELTMRLSGYATVDALSSDTLVRLL